MKLFSKMFTVLSFVTLGLVQTAFADDNIADSLATDNDEFSYKFDYDEFSKDGFKEFNFFRFFNMDKAPRIDIDYSFAKPAINSDYFGMKFVKIPSVGISAGYVEDKLSKDGGLIRTKYKYLRFAIYNQDFGSSNLESDKLVLDGWKFTSGDKTGYGWVLSDDADLTLSNGDNFNWTRFSVDSIPMDAKDWGRLGRFNNEIKFGRSFEAGVNLRLWNQLGISASYEQEHLFPRHLFWYWAGSELVEAALTGLTTEFIDDVTKRSKIGGPIINFIIRNGIAYGLYELRKKDMNWPFNTEAPMYVENFKLGINFTF